MQVANVAATWASRLEIISEVRATRPRRSPGKGRIKDVDSDLGARLSDLATARQALLWHFRCVCS